MILGVGDGELGADFALPDFQFDGQFRGHVGMGPAEIFCFARVLGQVVEFVMTGFVKVDEFPVSRSHGG